MNSAEASDARWTRVGAPLAAQAAIDSPVAERQSFLGRRDSSILISAVVWLALMAYWLLADVLLTLYPAVPSGRQVDPDGLAALAISGVLGLIGIWCAHRTGFPGAWDTSIPASRRLLLPVLLGVGFGALAIVIEEVTRSLHILEAVFGPANVAFPASLLTSTDGAIKLELYFLLFPLPLLLWLISGVLLRGRGQNRTVLDPGSCVLRDRAAAAGRSTDDPRQRRHRPSGLRRIRAA